MGILARQARLLELRPVGWAFVSLLPLSSGEKVAARPDEGASNQFLVRKHPPHPSLPRSRLRLRGMGIQRQPPQTTWGRGDATRRHVAKYATLKLTLRVVESGTKVIGIGRWARRGTQKLDQ